MKRKSRLKKLTPKQIEALKKRKENGIPPWIEAMNKNTIIDLNALGVEQILYSVELALAKEGTPRDELEQIQTYARACQKGWDIIRNSTRREAKNREELLGLYRKLEMLIDNLNNSKGFDLHDRATW